MCICSSGCHADLLSFLVGNAEATSRPGGDGDSAVIVATRREFPPRGAGGVRVRIEPGEGVIDGSCRVVRTAFQAGADIGDIRLTHAQSEELLIRCLRECGDTMIPIETRMCTSDGDG